LGVEERAHLFKTSFALVFLAVLLPPFAMQGFVRGSYSSALGTDNVSNVSVDGQSRPLAVVVFGNESFLQLGKGLSVKLDPSFGTTVGNRTVYDSNSLRRLAVPLIVDFKNLQYRANVSDCVTALGGFVNMTYTELPLLAVTVPAENVSALAGNDVLSLTPFSDVKVSAFLNESVPLIKPPLEWASLEQKEGRGINGTGISIAIVDTGIDASHPDFYFENGTSKIRFSVSFVPGEDANDYFGHGTHVAGIAAGTGKASGYEFVGVAPGASLYNVKVLNSEGMGYTSWVIAGIEYAVTHAASVINLSLGSNVNNDGTDPLSLACNWAVERGVTVVVAAGNAGPNEYTVGSPACARNVITVGASTKQDEVAVFSSRGPTADFRIKPDVAAPGVDIVAPASVGSWIWTNLLKYEPSKIVGNYYFSLSGTSMATPHVAGVAALLKELHPTWSPKWIKAAMMNSAQDLNQTSSDQGSGRVNAYLAATIPVLAVASSVSFGLVHSGDYRFNITLYNVEDNAQTVEARSIDTYQISNRTRRQLVSTDLSLPSTMPAGGSMKVQMILSITEDVPEDSYDGALTLHMNNSKVRVPHSFLYESVIIARAISGGATLYATFFAYAFPTPTGIISYSEGTTARFFVPSGTYVVHAMSAPMSLESHDLFILTAVVNVEKESVTEAILNLDTARTISIPKTAADGRSFSLSFSDRQLWVYFDKIAAGVMVSGSGFVNAIHLSDTHEDVYFNTVPYTVGAESPEVPFRFTTAGGSRTSDAFYSLSWWLHGVNSTAPTRFMYDRSDLVRYVLKYKADLRMGNNPGVGYWVFSPNPSGYPFWIAFATVYDIFPGVLRNLYVKCVDLNANDPLRREYLVAFCASQAYTAVLDPHDGIDRTVVFMKPPYQTEFAARSGQNETLCDYAIMMNDKPFTELWAGATAISVHRDGTEVQSKSDRLGWTVPFTITFPSNESGTYTINVNRTTGLTLWDKIDVLAQFTKPSIDENPPSISHVDVNPIFNSSDSSLHVSFNASDDVGVQECLLWYSLDCANWVSADLTRSGDHFDASVPLSESVQNVSLRIKAYDASNNFVQHTITPVSIRGKPLTLSTAPTVSVKAGLWNTVQVTSDSRMDPYTVQTYENGVFGGNYLIIRGVLEWFVFSQGNTLIVAKDPFGYFFSKVNLSFVQDVSLAHCQSSAQTTVEVVWPVTFGQTGVAGDLQRNVLTVDGIDYGITDLPKTFFWATGSNHTFGYHSPLVVASGAKQYEWTSTTGTSTSQSGSITVAGSGTVIGNYLTRVHDVAITSIATDRTWVYQRRSANINVTVQNHGDFNETVTLTLYYNVTANEIIATQNITLLVGESKTLSLMWSTLGIAYCRNYTLIAVATIPADIIPTDNTFASTKMAVRIIGDLNGDYKVDIGDIAEAAKAFGAYSEPALTHSQWNPDADINQDGKIDIKDLVQIAKNFGTTHP